jgi:hypothetical protein
MPSVYQHVTDFRFRKRWGFRNQLSDFHLPMKGYLQNNLK